MGQRKYIPRTDEVNHPKIYGKGREHQYHDLYKGIGLQYLIIIYHILCRVTIPDANWDQELLLTGVGTYESYEQGTSLSYHPHYHG